MPHRVAHSIDMQRLTDVGMGMWLGNCIQCDTINSEYGSVLIHLPSAVIIYHS